MEPQQEDLVEKELRKNREAADKKLTDELAKIFKKSLAELTPQDKQFLFARASYLNREQRGTYKNVLAQVAKENEEKVKKELEAAGEEQPAPENDPNPNPAPGEEDEEDEEETEG